MKHLLLAPLMVIASLGSSNAANSGWQQIGQRDMYRTVVIDTAAIHNAAVYWGALRAVCVRRNYCNVIFFSAADRQRAATESGRLTDDDKANALLIYTTNKGFVWNCGLRPDADNCFGW